jgi:hypothetical protein
MRRRYPPEARGRGWRLFLRTWVGRRLRPQAGGCMEAGPTCEDGVAS